MILQRTLNVKHGLAQGPGSWTNPLCILSQLSADPELLLLESFWGRCGKCFTRASPTPNKQWQVHALCSGPSAALHPHTAAVIYSEAKATSGLSLRKQKGQAKTPCMWFVWIHSIWSEVHGDMFKWSHHALGHNFFLQWYVLQLSCISGMETMGFSCRFITWIQTGLAQTDLRGCTLVLCTSPPQSPSPWKTSTEWNMLCCEILVSYYFQ